MITKYKMLNALRDKTEYEQEREGQSSRTLLQNPIFGEAVNELFVDLAYEETATLREPGVERELAFERAKELNIQRLMLEIVVERLEDKIRYIESNKETEDSNTPDSNGE